MRIGLLMISGDKKNQNQIKLMEDNVMQLETHCYDWLVIGTGMEESLFAAHISKIAGKKVKNN